MIDPVPVHENCMKHEAHDQDIQELKGARQRHGEELSKRPTWHLMLIILGGMIALSLAAFNWMAETMGNVGTEVQEIHENIRIEFKDMSLDIKELQVLVEKNGRGNHR